MDVFERLESEVRAYSRDFPVVFSRARGSFLHDERGREYLDFFCGAGALNYGHNDPRMVRRVVRHLLHHGVVHGLDMATEAKREFLLRFESLVLAPRGLDHRVQFTGPTGTNAVEAALKLARKVTGRGHVVHFRDAYHGVTLGSLAVSGDSWRRRAAGVPLTHAVTAAFDGDLGPGEDTTVALDAQMARMAQEGHAPAPRAASRWRRTRGCAASPRSRGVTARC
jgi:diaminobutyrate-2-oxoglutarate transaminase